MAPKDPHFTEPEPGDESEEDEYEYEEDENNPPPVTAAQMEALMQRVKSEKVPLRVHDVIIKGNTKTKDSVIDFEIQALKTVTSVQELLQAAEIASIRLQKLDIFDSVNVTLDAGPPGLPGTSNVIVEVVECKNPVTGDFGIFTKPEVAYFVILWLNVVLFAM